MTTSTIKSPHKGKKSVERKDNKSVYEDDPFNAFQNFLYRRALYGLSIYSKHELNEMHPASKKRIELIHHRTQIILNVWKQELINKATTELFKRLFPTDTKYKYRCEIVEVLKQPSKPDPFYKNSLSFKDLGITKEMIVKKLVKKKMLHKQFYNITQESLRALNFGKQFNY